MLFDAIADPLWSLEIDRRRAVEMTRVLDAHAAETLRDTRRGQRHELVLRYAFESLMLRHQAQKDEYVLYPWLRAHHSDFAAQWVQDCRRIRFQQAYVLESLRALPTGLEAPRGDSRSCDGFEQLARLEREQLEVQALEMLPIIRGWSPRMALAHLSARLADFDAREEVERRLERPLRALRLLGARFPARRSPDSLEWPDELAPDVGRTSARVVPA